MSVVSNTINAIPGNFGKVNGNPSNYDLEDKTFSNLLEKQIQAGSNFVNNLFSQVNEAAEFAGIEGIDISDLITSTKNQKKEGLYHQAENNKTEDVGSSEMIAFLSKPFDSHSLSDGNHNLMNFAKKHAANFYNKCASNVVVDLKEFVEDAIKLS